MRVFVVRSGFCGLAEPVFARSQILFPRVLCGSAAESQSPHWGHALSAGCQVALGTAGDGARVFPVAVRGSA